MSLLEQALAAQSRLLDAANDAIIVRQFESARIQYWNEGATRLYGWSRAEALGKSTHELLETEFPAPIEQINETLLETGTWTGLLLHHTVRARGAVIVESRWSLQRDAQGRPHEIIEINRDITERERALDSARRFEERFYTIFRESPAAINISILPEGRILDVNSRFLDFFGFQRGEVIGQKPAELGLWADVADRTRYVATLQATGAVGLTEGRFRRKTGEIVHALFTMQKMEVQGSTVVVTTRMDITDRKRNEELLGLQSAVTAALTQARDLKGALDEVLRLICEHTGWEVGEAWLPSDDDSRLEWNGACYSAVPGADAFFAASAQRSFARGERFIGRVWQAGAPTWTASETTIPWRRIHLIPGTVRSQCAVPVLAEGAAVAVLAFFARHWYPQDQRQFAAIADIAAQLGLLIRRRRAEEALRLSEERFSQFAKNLPGALFMKDTAGRYVFANPVAEKMQGVAPGGSLGKTGDGLFPSATVRRFQESDNAVLKGGCAIQTIETVGTDDPRYLLVTKFPIPGPSAEPALLGGMSFDITEQKRGEVLLALQSHAAIALSRAPDFRGALAEVIRLICEHTGWAVGEAWVPDADATRLVWSGALHSTIPKIGKFIDISASRAFQRGESFIGAAWVSGKPAWRSGSAELFWRACHIHRGIQAHCVVPVTTEGETIAILSFFSTLRRPHDQRLLDAIVGIAAQLAMLFKRKRAEDELRASEERFALFARHTQGALFIKDAEGRYVYSNPVTDSIKGFAVSGVLGKTDVELFARPVAQLLRANDRQVLDRMEAMQFVESVGEDGASCWLVEKFPIPGNPPLLGGTAINITELKRSEGALRRALDEKERLHADLHDNTVQVLFGVGMGLEECARLTDEDPALAAAHIRQAVAALNVAIGDLRKYIAGKRPQVLTAQQMRAELGWLVKMTGAGAKPRFRMTVDDAAVSRLSTEDALELMAIAREALSNSLRHSGAEHGRLTLDASPRGVVLLEVADDGNGFDPRSIERHAAGGLRNMQARARRLGARLRISSLPDCGTRIVLLIPRRKARQDHA